jgi:prepilin-type N-terminal cleavage/methylation domain-containing protein
MMLAKQTGRRGGFTLVELMVVILIIGLLAGLLAAGAFQVISSRRSGNTELLLKKVDSALQKQWQAVVDQAETEEIPPQFMNPQFNSSGVRLSWGLLDMAGGDTNRARVIWKKLRLKQEFPMTFGETFASSTFGSGITPFAIGRPDPAAKQFVPYFNPPLLPNATIARALQGVQTGNPVADPREPSPLLLLSLTQARKGHVISQDDLGTGAIGRGTYVGTAPPPSVDLQQIVDAWNNPIVFWRWPTANVEVTNSNPASSSALPAKGTGSVSQKFADPLDPSGTLQNPLWNNWTNYSNRMGVWAFEMLLHSVHINPPPNNGPFGDYNPTSQPKAYYTVPVVASAGRNGKLGIAPPTLPMSLPNTYPLAIVPDPMLPILGNDENDNLYSHRLRLGARGD